MSSVWMSILQEEKQDSEQKGKVLKISFYVLGGLYEICISFL